MASFAAFTNEVMHSEQEFLRMPRMIQDMLRFHAQLHDCREFNQIQIPILAINGGCSYSAQDIVLGLNWLKQKGYGSFVLAESSTYCLRLLHDILFISEKADCPSCSVTQAYDKVVTTKWQDTREIAGVVIRLTAKRAKGASLPSNVIQ